VAQHRYIPSGCRNQPTEENEDSGSVIESVRYGPTNLTGDFRRMQVLYIDTERKFSAGRLVEVAAARASGAGPDPNPDSVDPAALAARVLIATPASAADLLAMLQASLQLISIASRTRL